MDDFFRCERTLIVQDADVAADVDGMLSCLSGSRETGEKGNLFLSLSLSLFDALSLFLSLSLFLFFLRISALSRTPLFFPSVSRARGSVNTHSLSFSLSLYPSILAPSLSPSLSSTLRPLSFLSLSLSLPFFLLFSLSLSLSLGEPLSRSPYRSFFVTDVRKTT